MPIESEEPEQPLDSVITQAIERMTPRQREIFHWYCRATVKQISAALFLSEGTVKNHLDNAYLVFEESGVGFAPPGCKGRYYCFLLGLSMRSRVLPKDRKRVIYVNPRSRHA